MDDTVLAPSATLGVDVWSRLTALERERARLRFQPYLSARGFSDGGAYLDLGIRTTAGYEVRALTLEATGGLGGYAATFAIDNALYGDLALSARLAVGVLAIRAEGYARFRSYTADQLDGIYGGRAVLSADHERWRWELQAGADQRRSSDPSADRAEVYVGLSAGGQEGAWQWQVNTNVYVRRFASAPRDGREWIVRARLDRALTPRLALFLATEVGRAAAAAGDDEALTYRRAALEVGVSVQFASAPPRPENASAELLPDGRYRFVLHAPEAREVILLADFLEWDPARGNLHPAEDGTFEGTFAVPPGRHRYRMLVDGVPVTPPAAAYADDGFGGRDAVLTVE